MHPIALRSSLYSLTTATTNQPAAQFGMPVRVEVPVTNTKALAVLEPYWKQLVAASEKDTALFHATTGPGNTHSRHIGMNTLRPVSQEPKNLPEGATHFKNGWGTHVVSGLNTPPTLVFEYTAHPTIKDGPMSEIGLVTRLFKALGMFKSDYIMQESLKELKNIRIRPLSFEPPHQLGHPGSSREQVFQITTTPFRDVPEQAEVRSLLNKRYELTDAYKASVARQQISKPNIAPPSPPSLLPSTRDTEVPGPRVTNPIPPFQQL
jgi:hypothetical protein